MPLLSAIFMHSYYIREISYLLQEAYSNFFWMRFSFLFQRNKLSWLGLASPRSHSETRNLCCVSPLPPRPPAGRQPLQHIKKHHFFIFPTRRAKHRLGVRRLFRGDIHHKIEQSPTNIASRAKRMPLTVPLFLNLSQDRLHRFRRDRRIQ